jgi:sortase A
LVFAAGLGLLLYPSVSGYINSRNQTRVVLSYRDDVEKMDIADIDAMFAAAARYNEELLATPDRWLPPDEAGRARYSSLLNVAGRSVIGTLEIPVIGVNLPIYHSTGVGVLQVGIGHLEGSSLPAGGAGTHTVITGHRGLPSSVLLSNLDRVEIGDEFTLRVLNRALVYRVDQIRVVLPDDFSELEIMPDKDYCTLLTCTPYGINSHRLLVRGLRAETHEDEAAPRPLVIRSEARRITSDRVLLVTLTPLLVILFIVGLFVSDRKP